MWLTEKPEGFPGHRIFMDFVTLMFSECCAIVLKILKKEQFIYWDLFKVIVYFVPRDSSHETTIWDSKSKLIGSPLIILFIWVVMEMEV